MRLPSHRKRVEVDAEDLSPSGVRFSLRKTPGGPGGRGIEPPAPEKPSDVVTLRKTPGGPGGRGIAPAASDRKDSSGTDEATDATMPLYSSLKSACSDVGRERIVSRE